VLAIFIAGILLPLVAAGEESNKPRMDDPAAGGGEAQVDVSIFYATNRRHNGNKAAADIFSGERGEPSYGLGRPLRLGRANGFDVRDRLRAWIQLRLQADLQDGGRNAAGLARPGHCHNVELAV
jgi:hypothetical protein